MKHKSQKKPQHTFRHSKTKNDSAKIRYTKPEHTKLPQGKPQRPKSAEQAKPGFKEYPLLVWGKHVVESFLTKLHHDSQTDYHFETTLARNYLLHVLVDQSGKIPEQLSHVCDVAKLLKIPVLTHRADSKSWPLAEVHEGIVHQRICLQVPEYPTQDISFACETISEFTKNNQFGCAGIVLDQVQDPRNFGAILRSAAFFGIKFVIYAQNRQADISPLVLKASAGGAFETTLIPVVNINRTLEELKQAGSWILGTANTSQAIDLHKLPKDRVWVCVLGNEGTGLRAEVLKNCDFLTKIPGGTSTLDSLNVSVAAGIMMHTLQEKSLCSV